MALQHVGKFTLRQNGGYVCRTMFNCMDENGDTFQSKQTGNQLQYQNYTISPSDLGVPDGSTVWFYLWVMASLNDQTGAQAFIFDKSSPSVAHYSCSGITINVGLNLDGLS